MKFNFKKVAVILVASIMAISCSKDEEATTTMVQTNSAVSTINTWVKLTAITSGGIVKPNYKIMIFSTQPSQTAALPIILKEVTTDANGLAYFDLNSMITSTTPTTYYFEAFVSNGAGGYTWKSITHFNTNLAKGSMATSSIIVN